MGFFGQKKGYVPHHPRPEQVYDLPLSLESVTGIFGSCADFEQKTVIPQGMSAEVTLCWISGMVKTERLNDYIIRPLATNPLPETVGELKKLLCGGLWNLSAEEPETLDEAVYALLDGSAAVFLPGGVLCCAVPTEEKRSVESPENESEVKGARDSFVESLRTNTSLVRRRLREPKLQIEELTVGRRSRTPVDLVWIDGLTNAALVEGVRRQLDNIDIDAVLATADLEEYLVQSTATTFPQIAFTERPDRFCRGLLDGRVGFMVDGLPLGALLPGTLGQFMQAPQDRCYHWAITSALLILRYVCLLLSLLLPGFYVAVAAYHLEMIPPKLAASIIASKQDVPFSTVFEVLMLLAAFEILQEAGLRLPKTIGQTVSIIGGLVVGQAAVDAKILSPAVVIVVAAAGIAGFTMPDQDFANGMRIWRFLLTIAAGIAGLFGLAMGFAVLISHLAGLETLGVAYLTPFAANAGEQVEGHAVLRQPMPQIKLRELSLHPQNIRRQK